MGEVRVRTKTSPSVIPSSTVRPYEQLYLWEIAGTATISAHPLTRRVVRSPRAIGNSWVHMKALLSPPMARSQKCLSEWVSLPNASEFLSPRNPTNFTYMGILES
eukprot:734651-Amphidinium_carterae.1